MKWKTNRSVVLTACAVCLILPPILNLPEFDSFRLACFSIPAAWIASLLSGGDFAITASAGVVTTERMKLLVIPACSGFTFFMILCAAGIWTLRSADWRIPLFAYPAALRINAFRILCWDRGRSFWPRGFFCRSNFSTC